MRIESWVGVTAALSLLCGGVVAAGQQQCCPFSTPANVKLLHDIERAIQFIYEGSPSSAPNSPHRRGEHLRVTVRIDPSIPSRCRAFTIIQRRGQNIRAEIHLPPSSDHAELLAHEFEHVLEQIEGLDLRSLARVKDSGVDESDDAVFETDRAQAAGRIVKAETRRSGAPAAD